MSCWIDLNRRLLPTDDPQEVPPLATLPFIPGGTFTWTDVLPSPCVVLLGEAGSGKSSELRAQADRLAREGHAAFFLPIEVLAKDDLETPIEGNRAALEPWKQGREEAWFFLDSVDEAKLHGESLSRALAKFEKGLGDVLSRCHVIVSSRHSDWRAQDEAILQRLAERLVKPPAPAPEASRKQHVVRRRLRLENRTARSVAPVQLLQLASLNRDQIRIYAEQKEHVPDMDAFMAALGQADLWGLAGRPLDVEWLARSWKRRRGFGSLRTMIEEDICEKLTDRRDPVLYGAPISSEQARNGVERIALALTMIGAEAVALPGSATEAPGTSLDARDLLRWKDDELLSLLRLAVFDPTTYGRVRFHHRTVREYLAARCLYRLRHHQGLLEFQLDRLIFATVEGRNLARPGFEAVVAWLALDDPDVRQRAIEVAPEHLVDLGDPSEFKADARRSVLRSYARRFAGRKRTLHHFDRAGLERFAGEEMAPIIRELLAPHTSDDLRDALLQMIGRKKLASLADAALQAATEEVIPPFLRAQAIRAVSAAGTPEQKSTLARAMIPWCARERDTANELLENLFPGVSVCFDMLKEARNAIRGRADYSSTYSEVELGRLFADRFRLRRALFWDAVERWRTAHTCWPRHAYNAWPYHLFDVTQKDADWLEEDAIGHPEEPGRVIAFDGLMTVLNAGPNAIGNHDRIERMAARRPELRKHFERRINHPLRSRKDAEAVSRFDGMQRRRAMLAERRRMARLDELRTQLPRIVTATRPRRWPSRPAWIPSSTAPFCRTIRSKP